MSGADGPPVIRPAVDDDLADIARIHLDAFPESVLAELGAEAVRRNYRWQLHGPHDLTAVVAEVDGRVAGFLFGGTFRGSLIGFLKAEKLFLSLRLARHPGILFREVGRDRLATAARLLARRPSAPAAEDPAGVPRRSFGVLAIAVDPEVQKQGVGRLLMQAAVAGAREHGDERLHLTVEPSNHRAVSFYENLGFRRVLEDGSWKGKMAVELADLG